MCSIVGVNNRFYSAWKKKYKYLYMKTKETTYLSSIFSFNLKKEICFILGNYSNCFLIMSDNTVKVVSVSLQTFQNVSQSDTFLLKINRNIIINTLQFVRIFNSKERLILMKTGNILKVSRRNWSNFK